MAHITKNVVINAPIEKVYAFARDPERWSSWWVGLSAPDKITGNGEVGTIVTHNFAMAGFTFPVTSKVVEDKPGPKQARWKGTIEGPLAGQHIWTYTAKDGATEVTTEIDYTVPGKALGKITDKLIVEKMQERAMEASLENLKLLCETEVAAKVRV
jgi:coenzyme Q-binding protein COQ10